MDAGDEGTHLLDSEMAGLVVEASTIVVLGALVAAVTGSLLCLTIGVLGGAVRVFCPLVRHAGAKRSFTARYRGSVAD
ncbi:hypothetical protein ABH922_003922 [Rhodococcus sp. 27YEA15]